MQTSLITIQNTLHKASIFLNSIDQGRTQCRYYFLRFIGGSEYTVQNLLYLYIFMALWRKDTLSKLLFVIVYVPATNQNIINWNPPLIIPDSSYSTSILFECFVPYTNILEIYYCHCRLVVVTIFHHHFYFIISIVIIIFIIIRRIEKTE